jgi:hypothetical protein
MLGAFGTAAATLAVWWAWLGWDVEPEVDPITSVETGPYEVWQVIGCVLSLGVLAVVAGMLFQPWLVALAMTIAFTTAWTIRAAASDDSGLWLIGGIGVLVATGVGSTLLSVAAWAFRSVLRAHRQRRTASPVG